MRTAQLSPERGIQAFAALGTIMRESAAGSNSGLAGRFTSLTETLYLSNPWFTPENVRRAIGAAGNILTGEKLTRWLSAYPSLQEKKEPETIGVVMAGNIPMVGFHDMLCVLITGNRLQARMSSRDEHLIRAVADTLIAIDPAYERLIELTADRLDGFTRVIATGSNNTSRYFEYYFRNIPSIIRHNRNSIAVLDGTETKQELSRLGDDIFAYFGLGCRNVSKLWLPEGYDTAGLLHHWEKFETLRSHYKYAVNYDHNKAVLTVNRESFIDGGFVILKESPSLTPPMAVVHYEYYSSGEAPSEAHGLAGEMLQCIAGHGHLPFGTTQQPELWDYADNRDTVSFL
ncbi:MAG: acyl-CoA reductase, partial [Bacteroidales bacterium]|nr:acyl-CoA reductase [Bacteroidales bacterium]